MHLALSEDQELLRDTFAQLFASESSPERVRAAEASGFDDALWKQLVETGALGIRASEALGGADASLFDAVLLAEQAGRHLASGPLLENIAVCSALSRLEDATAQKLVSDVLDGNRIASLALSPLDGPQLVPGGAVAHCVLAFTGEALVLLERAPSLEPLPNIGSGALDRWDPAACECTELSRGEVARATWESAREEWRLLMAAALGGLGRRALEIGAAYASERTQFGRLIGAFQAVAHPLADGACAVEGGQVLVWRAVEAIAQGHPDAGVLGPLAFAHLAEAAAEAARVALHTHGGYGLSLEYDIQLYHRRAKAWALRAGNPRDALVEAADRRWRGARVALPPAGELSISFELGEKAEAFRQQVHAFLEAHPASDEVRANQFNWDGHDPEFNRALAEAGLLFPTWPEEYGGRNSDPLEMAALSEELDRAGRCTHAIGTTRMVAQTLMKFASEELKRDVLPRVAAGELVISLGYTEPGSGSDVAAAQTRAVRDGDEWVIEGQKMFTSGAELADYVFLLTRTDPDARKHEGLTMFLVPLDAPGVEIQAIHTLSDERTNATYYTGVRIPDHYRIGEVNGGWTVIGYSLHLEHGGSGVSGKFEIEEMLEAAVAWARGRALGQGTMLDEPRVREELGALAAKAEVCESLARRGFWCGATGQPDRGEGAMSITYKKVALVECASRVMDLTAPDSVLSRGAEAAIHSGLPEFSYRHGTAWAIYGGTKEILKSIVAQATLEMPRSRS